MGVVVGTVSEIGGPNRGSVFVDDPVLGLVPLSVPENALDSDDQYVMWVLALGQLGHALRVSGFGFSIPNDATIVGILVEVERSVSVALAVVDGTVRLVKGGTLVGSDHADATPWSSDDRAQLYGSPLDLWGTSWTPTDLNASNFGVVIVPQAAVAAVAQIDQVRVTVAYTYAGFTRTAVGSGVIPTGVRVGDGMACVGCGF